MIDEEWYHLFVTLPGLHLLLPKNSVLCLSVLAPFWLSPVRRVWCWAKLLLSMFGDGAKPVFGLHNTPGSSSRSLGSGSPLSADKGLPDADWSIPSIYTIQKIEPSLYMLWTSVSGTHTFPSQIYISQIEPTHLPSNKPYKTSLTTVYMHLFIFQPGYTNHTCNYHGVR